MSCCRWLTAPTGLSPGLGRSEVIYLHIHTLGGAEGELSKAASLAVSIKGEARGRMNTAAESTHGRGSCQLNTDCRRGHSPCWLLLVSCPKFKSSRSPWLQVSTCWTPPRTLPARLPMVGHTQHCCLTLCCCLPALVLQTALLLGCIWLMPRCWSIARPAACKN